MSYHSLVRLPLPGPTEFRQGAGSGRPDPVSGSLGPCSFDLGTPGPLVDQETRQGLQSPPFARSARFLVSGRASTGLDGLCLPSEKARSPQVSDDAADAQLDSVSLR
eukprot:4805462-Pyramimonas_sp.AAC.1